MGQFETILGKFILSALLIISLFSYIAITQSDNNAVDPLADNDIFNESVGFLISQIDAGTGNATEKFDTFNAEEPKAGFSSIVLLGIVSVGKSFSQIIMGFFTAIIKLPVLVLGIPETIYNLVFTWLVIGVIISAWLLYKLGG